MLGRDRAQGDLTEYIDPARKKRRIMDFIGLLGAVVACAAAISWLAGVVLPLFMDSELGREARRKGVIR